MGITWFVEYHQMVSFHLLLVESSVDMVVMVALLPLQEQDYLFHKVYMWIRMVSFSLLIVVMEEFDMFQMELSILMQVVVIIR